MALRVRCIASPGSPSWKTTSPRRKRRRRVWLITRRCSSGVSEVSSFHCMHPVCLPLEIEMRLPFKAGRDRRPRKRGGLPSGAHRAPFLGRSLVHGPLQPGRGAPAKHDGDQQADQHHGADGDQGDLPAGCAAVPRHGRRGRRPVRRGGVAPPFGSWRKRLAPRHNSGQAGQKSNHGGGALPGPAEGG